MRAFFPCVVAALLVSRGSAGPYAPAAGQAGSTAIAANSPNIVAWALLAGDLQRGPQQIGDAELGNASFGLASEATREANATFVSPTPVVSLGDGGSITLTFANPITDGVGFDFAVFENGFSDNFLELAFVEVSSDGSRFERFDAVSLTPTTTQVNGDDAVGPFGSIDPTNLNNLAGKYRASFGTPFDLSELAGRPGLDITRITHVRIVDVIGSINPSIGTRDSLGNLINDPWATPYDSSGFDLDAIGVIHQVPEPATLLLLGSGLFSVLGRRRR